MKETIVCLTHDNRHERHMFIRAVACCISTRHGFGGCFLFAGATAFVRASRCGPALSYASVRRCLNGVGCVRCWTVALTSHSPYGHNTA